MKRRVTVDEWLGRLSAGEFQSSANARKSVGKQQAWSQEDKDKAMQAITLAYGGVLPAPGSSMNLRELLNVAREVAQVGAEMMSVIERAKNIPQAQPVMDGVLGCMTALNNKLEAAHGGKAQPAPRKKMSTRKATKATSPVAVPSHGGNGSASTGKLSFSDLAPPRVASG